MKSTVRNDKRKELIVAEFLDRYLYTKDNGFEFPHREYDDERQKLGVDIDFDFNGLNYVCDEKACTSYVNKGLGTFILELSSLRTTGVGLKDGWFLKEDNINDSYLFVWLDKAKTNDLEGGVDDIEEVEVCLVRKKKLYEHLESLGWTKDRLREKADSIRYDGDRYFYNVYKDGYQFCYTSSAVLIEQPINIKLTRGTYKKLSDFNKVIMV